MINPPQLQLRPFSFDHFMRPNPVQPIKNGDWGPPNMSQQIQQGIAGILPALADAYKGAKTERETDLAADAASKIGTTQAEQATSLSQPGQPYGPAPVLDAGTPGGSGDPGMRRQYQDPTYALIKKEEGYRDRPYDDGGTLRVGYGSDTYTMPDGTVGRVGKGTTVTQEMADADLQRRVGEFQAGIRKQVPGFDSLPATTKAALTSVAYNYGSLPESVVAAANSGNTGILAASVAGLDANPQRRRREAALIMSSTPGGATPAPTQSSAVPQQAGSVTGLTDQTNAYKARASEMFPNLRITSEYRSPEHNQAVGGATGSQHMHGRAIDVDVSRMSEPEKQALVRDAIQQGARGIGWYNNGSMHIDFRPGAVATWGPNRSVSSIGQTPGWFQAEAAALRSSGGVGGGDTAVAGGGGPSGPGTPSATAGTQYNAVQPVPPQQQPAPQASAFTGMSPPPQQSPMAQSQIQQPQQRPPQPQIGQPLNLQVPPPGSPAQTAMANTNLQAPVQMADASGTVPVPPPRPQQTAAAQPGFVPGGAAPGPGIAVLLDGTRQAVDAEGNPLPAQPPSQPAPAQVAGPPQQQRPAVTPAGPQQIAQTAAQVDPNYRKALAHAIRSGNPQLVNSVINAGKELLGGPGYDFVNGPDGNLYRVNKRTGVPELAIQGPPKVQEVGGELYQYDPQTGKWNKAAGEREQWITMDPAEAKARGFDPSLGPVQYNTRTGQIQLPAKQGGSTNVSVNTGDNAEQRKLGENRAEQIIKTGNAAEAAQEKLRQITRMRGLLADIDTGKFSSGSFTIGQLAARGGLSDELLRELNLPDRNAQASAEVLESMKGGLVRGLIASGTFPTNNFSDADRQLLMSELPGMSNSKLANEIMLHAMEVDAQRAIDKQAAWRKYRLGEKAAGRTADFDDFNDQWQERLNTDIAPLIAQPQTQAEYDKLKPGALFKEVDVNTGKILIKRKAP